jgi:hypothetical protein
LDSWSKLGLLKIAWVRRYSGLVEGTVPGGSPSSSEKF